MSWNTSHLNPFSAQRRKAKESGRPRRGRPLQSRFDLERLETRLALAKVAPSNFPIELQLDGTELTITYSQSDPETQFRQTSDQQVVIEIEEFFAGLDAPTQQVNVYASSNPGANFGAPNSINKTFLGITAIHVNVPDYDLPGVNNNSLTIKGINSETDRIIVSGSGRTAAGRWSDETADQLQIVFDIAGIDDLTVTAGGVINVSGAFTNDTGDASIHASGNIVEDSTEQQTATIIVGETTPVPGLLPQSRLVSDFIEIIGAELDIYSDIVASNHVILRDAEMTPETARRDFVLPYDISVTDPAGVLELYSTQSIVQLQGSTLTANKLVAVSTYRDIDGPWMIDLGSVDNDFNTVSLGMVSAPGDAPVDATEGRIGIRDLDDLTVGDFGILASTAEVTLRTAGQLNINAAIKATGLTAQSDYGIATSAAAIMSIGDLGITLDAGNTAALATGDITLNGRMKVGSGDFTKAVTTAIRSKGTTTIAGGLLSLQAGSLLVNADEGIVVDSPIQAGSTILNVNSTAATVYDGDIRLVSNGVGSTGITVNNKAGTLGIPNTIQATEGISLESTGDIVVAGSVLSGSIYGPTKTSLAALPSITIKSTAAIAVKSTGSLRTSAFETDPNSTTNPLVGLISIASASQLEMEGSIRADGAVDIDIVGDVDLYGPTTARENIVVDTSAGSIDIQGRTIALGGTYTLTPAADSQRQPNIILSAINGGISTSGAGTLTAGTVTVGGTKTFGDVTLNAQQDIEVGANIITPGLFTASSKLGAFDLSAVLRTDNGNGITISAGNGIVQSDPDFARIVVSSLTLTNTAAAGGVSDIDLRAKNNQISGITAQNFADGGSIRIANNGAIAIGGLLAERDGETASTISLASTGAISQTGAMQANDLVVSNSSLAAITLTNSQNNVDRFAARSVGSVSYSDADDFETGVNRDGKLGVEVSADVLTLRSVATGSKIRVVSGLKYRTLSIAAGANGGADVGTVEYVTTSTTDNQPTVPGVSRPFQGSLRDMIKYANDNTATAIIDGGRKPQPTTMVFDETGYAVEEITLGAALPAFVKPVTFNGGRLEATATTDRLGIQGTSKIATGLAFGLGSNESTITKVAAYGFTAGSAIVLGSANNSVTDVYAGLKADGTTSANLVGLEITGTTASNNLVGSTVMDVTTANRFGGNTAAGILIRNKASGNRVYGNFIGVYDDPVLGAIGAANGDGIRITGSSGNLIGAPDEVQPDGMPSRSNFIVGNAGNGIQIVTATGASLANANRIRNNFVSGNTVGVSLSASKFAVLGGTDGNSSNVIVNQKSSGVAVSGSTNVQIFGNLVGLSDTATAAGNEGNGISITALSQQVEISSGNRISANTGNGIAVGTGSTAVTITGNTIGGTLDDGTAAGNGSDGVAISASIGNTIGAGNSVSNNGRHGISISDARATALASGNRIFGSEIFANTGDGLSVSGGSGSTIGGTTAGSGNVIYSNGGDGIRFDFSTATGAPTGYAIQGNLIGTNANSDVALLGNTGSGIVISRGTRNVISDGNVVMNNGASGVELLGGTANVIGSVTAGKGNTITNNIGSGIRIAGVSGSARATGHVISGNAISENGESGVTVADANVSAITIGRKVTAAGFAGLGNTISSNVRYAVEVAGSAQQVGIQGNSMFGNELGSIFLAAGANRSTAQTLSLASAVIRGVTGGGQTLTVTGSLQNTLFRNQQYSVEIYANRPADGDYSTANTNLTGYQNRRLLGTATVTADARGNARFTFTLTARVAVGEVITATATSLRLEPGSTSNQSSRNVTANLPGIPTPRF